MRTFRIREWTSTKRLDIELERFYLNYIVIEKLSVDKANYVHESVIIDLSKVYYINCSKNDIYNYKLPSDVIEGNMKECNRTGFASDFKFVNVWNCVIKVKLCLYST